VVLRESSFVIFVFFAFSGLLANRASEWVGQQPESLGVDAWARRSCGRRLDLGYTQRPGPCRSCSIQKAVTLSINFL